jgi:alpha-galactosidase
MGLELNSRLLHFQAHLESGAFDVSSAPGNQRWMLQGAQCGLQVYVDDRLYRHPWRWGDASLVPESEREIDSGRIRQIQIIRPPDETGMACTITFALMIDQPLLLWKVAVENRGAQRVEVDRIEMLHLPPYSGQLNLANELPSRLAFFANGWQTWSYSGAYYPEDSLKSTRLGPLRQPARLYDATPPRRRGRFASDMFGVLADLRSRAGLLLGFLSQQQHFGSFEVDLSGEQPWLSLWANGDRTVLAPGCRMETDWACLQFLEIDGPDPLGAYLLAAARQNRVSVPVEQNSPTGWCSWYQFSSSDYRGAVTPDDLRRNLRALNQVKAEIPLQVFQIDDGFQRLSGDWLDFSEPFKEGVAGLATEIRGAGFQPGLWLAPFIVHPRSKLAAEHPDWLLRTRQGKPVNTGFFWNAFTTALDLTHPDALAYAAEVVQTAVHEWGFGYLKLDFLFAAAVPARFLDASRTRAQVLRRGLQELRQAAGPQAFLLGCGCPLGPAIGLVNAMRINADTASRWLPAVWNIERFFAPEPDLPSVRNALHNALTRAPLHQRWWINDPDCLQLRQETRLSTAEVQSAGSVVILSGGSLVISDEMASINADRLQLLASLLPPLNRRPEVLDWFDSKTPNRVRLDLEGALGGWTLLAKFNWTDSPQPGEIRLSEYGLLAGQDYWGRDYWLQSSVKSESGRFQLGEIPPHGVRLLAVRPRKPGEPVYLGSDLHISQGLEVAEWMPVGNQLTVRLQRPARTRGKIELFLPGRMGRAQLNRQPLPAEPTDTGAWSFAIEFDSAAVLQVEWEA